MKKSLLVVLFLGAFAGCSSIKPHIQCELASGRAQVMQSVGGIGVGQELADADSLCAALVKPK